MTAYLFASSVACMYLLPQLFDVFAPSGACVCIYFLCCLMYLLLQGLVYIFTSSVVWCICSFRGLCVYLLPQLFDVFAPSGACVCIYFFSCLMYLLFQWLVCNKFLSCLKYLLHQWIVCKLLPQLFDVFAPSGACVQFTSSVVWCICSFSDLCVVISSVVWCIFSFRGLCVIYFLSCLMYLLLQGLVCNLLPQLFDVFAPSGSCV